MNNKLASVLRGVLVVVLGILIAVCGIGTTINLYFGVVSIIAGVLLLLLAFYCTAKRLPLALEGFLLGPILITVAIAIFMEKLSFGVLVGLLIFVLMGLGFGLILLGVVSLVRKSLFYGVGEIVIGALLVLFTALYLGIPDFATAFWIIVGILIALLGVAIIVFAFIDKPKKKA